MLVGIAALSFVAPTAVAAGCELTAEPASATAGSVFHLLGTGFTPTELTLQREGGDPTTLPLSLGSADPFDIPIGSKESDAGTWHATANEPGVCSASTTFVATLANTDTAAETGPAAPADDARPPLGAYLVVIGVGLGGGVLAAWRLNATLAARRIRP